ncbi:ATP/GTP binding protein [Arcticibacter svalbardensis MN12-7]|uniref:ATP/GTP binding protein n=1 Tax=Arcticibacter svalbardensis MN12-7 TaxID=1150600 RepID=R9GP53_9SPHI|nr:DNA/RNA helicase domain-containing protein [Arcticibacter svalbardensis]EOR93496.1 ATP/GTP binding protein [Arcticibacter svalbardensis MN12-7]
MIVYKKSKGEFLGDIDNLIIEDIVREGVLTKLRRKVGDSEYRSWQNSLQYMATILRSGSIPNDAGIAIEYNIPSTGNRIDFIVSGQDDIGTEHAILIELKQWDTIQMTNKDAIVRTRFKQGMSEELHPSYQAWSYSALLYGFNETVYSENIQLKPCAYLHNCRDISVITNSFYSEYLAKAPVFCKDNKIELREFIASFIKYGDKRDMILRIENGRIRPSKALADNINSMLKNNAEFIMIDAQKIVQEEVLALATSSEVPKKNVIIIHGGPGTGKSVVAINLLAKLSKKGLFASYVTRNSAPRVVYESKLTGSMKKSEISNFFKGSGSFTETKSNAYDVLIIDEAHRLNEKSGMFKKGENQIKEIINSSKCAVFFLDEDQKVTLNDIGSDDEIRKWATFYNAAITTNVLTSQFRCGGSDGYLAWLDNSLQVKVTANVILDTKEYDFRVFDDPNKLRDIIFEKNKERNKARLLAGICWKWTGKNDESIKDITIPEHDFSMRWNLGSDGMLWIMNPESVTEVGCIHTSQGLEVDYIGVIIGPDLVVRNGEIITDAFKRASDDTATYGKRQRLKNNASETKVLLDQIIKNTYRTLMSRGMKGCYIYCVDKETETYFKSLL